MKKNIKIIILSILIVMLAFTTTKVFSAEYIINSYTDEQINAMDRETAKNNIKTLRKYKEALSVELSSHGSGELQQKHELVSEQLTKLEKKINNQDIYYYMDNMSNSSNLYRSIDDLTFEELKDAAEQLTTLLMKHTIGNYTDNEVTLKRSEYNSKINEEENSLSSALKAAEDESYRSSLNKSQLKTRYNTLINERNKYKETEEKYNMYNVKASIINAELEKREEDKLIEKAIYYANNLDKARELSKRNLQEYYNVLEKAKNEAENTSKSKEYEIYMNYIDLIIQEKEKSSALVDYKDYSPSNPIKYGKATEVAGGIIAVIRNIGVGVALVSLMVLGIKYMLGSVEEKAAYKKSMIPFVVGVLLIAGGVAFADFIYNIVSKVL